MEVYIEWIDTPGGKRIITDGPFAFVQFTYGDIRVQKIGESDDDILIGHQEDGFWHRFADCYDYSDVVISTTDGTR